MECIQKTVTAVFKEKIANTADFLRFQEELLKQQQYRDAQAEEKDFTRRGQLRVES